MPPEWLRYPAAPNAGPVGLRVASTAAGRVGRGQADRYRASGVGRAGSEVGRGGLRRSPEIEAVARRLLRGIERCLPDAVSDLYSHQSGVRVIGSDPREWWSGYDRFWPILAAQLAEARASGGIVMDSMDVEGFEHQDTGWVAAKGDLRFGDEPAVDFRLTGVLELERGLWRFVQTHMSVGLRNEDTVGLSFSTGLEGLTETVEAEHPFLGGVAAPDGTVSIVFTDIEGSTALAEQLGDLRWVDLLHWHHRGVVEAAASRRGFVVKSMGDGYMLAFSSASDAVACAFQIVGGVGDGWQGVPISIRAGIHSGDAVRDVDDFYGHTVAVASRVAALARGGEILATRVVGELTRGRPFSWGQARTFELKGIKEPYEVVPLTATSAS
jgi:class 3 adenylate cyclase